MITESNPQRDAALAYARRGWSVIPVCSPAGTTGRCKEHSVCKNPGKTPLIRWAAHEKVRADEKVIRDWYAKWPEANVGIVTGNISGIAILDLDTGYDVRGLFLPRTPCVKTGSGGWHYYYRYPNDRTIKNSAGFRPRMDVRGEGGFIVAPPSRHVSGEDYAWEIRPDEEDLAEVPDWVVHDLVDNGRKTDLQRLLAGVPEGQRNESAASLTGKFLRHLPKKDWEGVAWPALLAWNAQNNSPPLNEDELRSVFDSVAKRAAAKREQRAQGESFADQLVAMALGGDLLLFHDQFQEPHAAIHGDGREIMRVKSKNFRRWLARLAWEQSQKTVSGEAMQSALQTLESKALFDGKPYELHVRMARHENAMWYDLGDGSAVCTDQNGWQIIERPPILFRRLSHQKPQTHPQPGGKVEDVLPFVNLRGEEEKILLQVFLITGMISGFPHPILITHGPQGSAKTTLGRIIKELLDPSQLKTITAHTNVREFVQFASHHWVFILDNLSEMPEWLSDALSRACTGDGLSKRELFTDDDDIIYSFQRVIGLNGINLVVEKPDLLDRSVLMGLERVPDNQRLREEDLWERFELAKPFILGAVFDALCGAIQRIDNVKLASYPRMADFTRWGCAIAEALGHLQTEFLNAYSANVNRQHDEAIEASLVAIVVVKLMEEQDLWEGSPTELLNALKTTAETLSVDLKAKGWPKTANVVWKRINEVRPNLAAKGIIAERSKGKERIITIRRSGAEGVGAVRTDAMNDSGQNERSFGDTSDTSDTSEETSRQEDTEPSRLFD